jgi:hypothetical protein
MKLENLRSLIRESVHDYIREIDEAAKVGAIKASIAKCEEAIGIRERKMNMEGLDEAYHDMLDKGKMAELKSEIKALTKSLEKYKKQLAKLEKVDEVKDDVVTDSEVEEVATDETMTEEAPIDETDVMAEMDVEETAINESFLKMQKLAGLITESEYREKIKEAEGDITPEQAAQMSLTIVNKAENDKAINSFAAEIAKDPKKSQELISFLKKQGINPANLNETIEDNAKQLALRFAKMADEKVTESLSEGNGRDITGRVMTGLASAFGGAVAAPWLAEKFGVFVHDYVNAFGDKITNPEAWVPLAGAAAGILLTIVGAKVYDLMTGQ